jgi:hypothetical protein
MLMNIFIILKQKHEYHFDMFHNLLFLIHTVYIKNNELEFFFKRVFCSLHKLIIFIINE